MAILSASPAPAGAFADALHRLRTTAQDYPTEFQWLGGIVVVFLLVFFMPVGAARFDNAILEGMALLNWYAREHVMLCLVPAFFIAGAIAVFVSQDAVMKYLGPAAHKVAAYGVASVSGSILAVCSCTVLPLFGGIYRRGAGLGPAIAFLYSGPAINVLAIVLTAKILGVELGIARAVGAVSFALVIGLIMHWIYRREEQTRAANQKGFTLGADAGPAAGRHGGVFRADDRRARTRQLGAGQRRGQRGVARDLCLEMAADRAGGRRLWPGCWSGAGGGLGHRWPSTAGVVAVLAGLIPQHPELAFSAGLIGLTLAAATQPGDGEEWLSQTWSFAKLILPLLLGGVLLAGFLLGRPGHEGIIPSEWVGAAVGGNSLAANFLSALVGAFMYFATLTEVPIVQGLIGSGMGKGPALALLLAGPALSLPNMLVIRGILGTQKTVVYCALVVVMATLTGVVFGTFYP